MSELTDLHCHLLPGLDDGPQTWDDALAMCRVAAAEGVRYAAALAHQDERWNVPPAAIRGAVRELARRLDREGVSLTVFPAAEVMAATDLAEAWAAGRLVSLGDQGRYLLVEMPHRLFVDLRPTVRLLRAAGVRVVLAHPERHPELLHEPERLGELIRLGCLVQVSAGSVTGAGEVRALREWFRRGCVHALGSDGHSPGKRPPLMAAAFARVREWVGADAAEQICGRNGLALLRGERLEVTRPGTPRRSWAHRLLG
jgi:protein-tyrosine phosphatase